MNQRPRKRLIIERAEARDPAIGRALWTLDDARRRTGEVLADLDEAALDWAATPAGNSIGTLLYHIAAIEADWLYAEVLEEEQFPPEVVALFPHDVRDERGRLTPVRGLDLEAHLRRLDAVRERLWAVFGAMAPADFRRARGLPDYDVTPEWVIHHLAQHEAEHRGQIGTLRELAGRAGQPR